MVTFRRERSKRLFHNPMNGFALEEQVVERRFDPLTGQMAIFNPVLEDKVRLFFGEHDWNLVEKIAKASQESCFMCPPRVREVTPRYPEDFLPEGRLCRGECTLFPNLFPVAVRHAVIAVGEAHLRRLEEFTPELIADGLILGVEFLKVCLNKDPEVRFGAVCANFLPPAGASLVHPHFQVVANPEASAEEQRLLSSSFGYFQRHGRSYWQDWLAEEERLAERFIARLGRVSFVTSFAPRGTNEVLGVIEGVSSIEAITEEDLLCMARGISATLKGYAKMGYAPFNFTLFLPPLREETSWFVPHVRLITRQNLYEAYRTDDYFLQRQLGEELILTPPERLKEIIKPFFKEVNP